MDEEPEENLPDDIFSISYEREIGKAVEAKNYRLAIRLWYLNTLKELADRKIIDYRQDRTDSEYVNSLSGGRFYTQFFRLTRNFEYTWYGQFRINENAFQVIQQDFYNFKSRLSK